MCKALLEFQQDGLDKAIVFFVDLAVLYRDTCERRCISDFAEAKQFVPIMYEACRNVSLRQDDRPDFMHTLGSHIIEYALLKMARYL
jgi:hypothetical protein